MDVDNTSSNHDDDVTLINSTSCLYIATTRKNKMENITSTRKISLINSLTIVKKKF